MVGGCRKRHDSLYSLQMGALGEPEMCSVLVPTKARHLHRALVPAEGTALSVHPASLAVN